MLTIAALAVMLVAAYAAPSHNYYNNRAGEAHVNYVNGLRQKYVNHVAEKVGAGTGTADKYGVPGTYVGAHGYGHGYAYGNGYGHGGYSHGYGHGYGHAYGHGHGYVRYPDYHNAHRQAYVNKVAESLGAGTGTYKEDGVPGTQLDRNHRHHY